MELVRERMFQYAILWHPSKEQAKEGQKSKMLIAPTMILGSDDKTVGMRAIKAIPAEYDAQLEQIEVVVQAF